MTIWMLYAIVVGGLVAAAGLAVERGARGIGRPTRFIWFACLALAVVVPLALPSIRQAPLEDSVELTREPTASLGPMTVSTIGPTIADRTIAVARAFDRPLQLVWLALSLWCLGRLVGAMISLRRNSRHWARHEIDGTPLFITGDVGPAVVAMPESRIVVPEWILSLDPGSLTTVIRHERQHMLAGDTWLVISSYLAVALVPWNPAVWFIRRRLRLALEVDCDARVLADDPRVDRYGSLLLAIAQHPRLASGLGATLTESTSDLERRIDAMTARPPKHPRLRAALSATLAALVLFVACSMPAPDSAVAPRAADPTIAGPIAAPGVLFDFQVERPASANPSNMPPRYPAALRAAGIQGGVTARFVVDTNGRVDTSTVEIVKSDHADFATAVREGLPQLRFFPAQVANRPVKQMVTMPFTFSLVGMERLVKDEIQPSAKPEVLAKPRVARVDILTETPVGLPGEFPEALQSNAPPAYPNQLRAANIAGMVQASFVVRPDGRVDMSTFKVRRSDHDAFTAAVREAVETWRFKPAMKDGAPVSRLMDMPFIFKLSR